MKPLHLLTLANGLLSRIGGLLQSLLLLVIRLTWGWQFMQTGWGKLHNLERTTNFFASLGIPAPGVNALMASMTELTCGTLLALGLLARFASPALMGVMVVAYATADKEALHAIFSNPDKFLSADEFLFLLAATIVFVFGPGRFSVDALIFKKKD
jgi:putative oxidoreductase